MFLVSSDHGDDTQSTRVSVSLTAWTPPEDINHPHTHPEVDFWLTGYNCNSDNINLTIIIETRIKSLMLGSTILWPVLFLTLRAVLRTFSENSTDSWNPCRLLNAGFSFWYRTNDCGHLLRLALAYPWVRSTEWYQVCIEKPRRYTSDWGRQWQTSEQPLTVLKFHYALRQFMVYVNDLGTSIILCLFWLVRST